MRFKRVMIANVTSLVSFIVILFMIRFNILTELDFSINTYMSGARSNEVTLLMMILTDLGSAFGIVLLSTVAMLFLIYEKRRRDIILFILSMVTGFLFEEILKMFIGRERPINGIIHASGYSFPSGHTTMISLFFFLLCYLYREKRLYILSAIVIFLVGFSRIYLGAHWMSDVLGGIILAIYIFSTSLIINSNWKRIYTQKI